MKRTVTALLAASLFLSSGAQHEAGAINYTVTTSGGYGTFLAGEPFAAMRALSAYPVKSYTDASNAYTASVRVLNQNAGTASGGVIIDRHTMLTNAHVADRAFNQFIPSDVRVEVARRGYAVRQTVPVSRIIKVPGVDVAILKTRADLSRVAVIPTMSSERYIRSLKKGASIYSAGYSRYTPYGSLSKSRISGWYGGLTRDQRLMFMKMKVRKGQSGSPIYRKGHLMGITAFSYNPAGAGTDELAKNEISGGIPLVGETRQFIMSHKD